jgi:hypothetical protein
LLLVIYDNTFNTSLQKVFHYVLLKGEEDDWEVGGKGR